MENFKKIINIDHCTNKAKSRLIFFASAKNFDLENFSSRQKKNFSIFPYRPNNLIFISGLTKYFVIPVEKLYFRIYKKSQDINDNNNKINIKHCMKVIRTYICNIINCLLLNEILFADRSHIKFISTKKSKGKTFYNFKMIFFKFICIFLNWCQINVEHFIF